MPPGAEFVLTGTQIVTTGLVIGVLISAPVGPVNVLCIQRTLERGFWGGVAAGLGAVLGDGLIASAAAFGLTAVASFMSGHKQTIQLVGGLILVAFGLRLLYARTKVAVAPGTESRLSTNAGVIPQTFFLTVTNPGAILGVFALFGGLGSLIGGLRDYTEALLLVAAVMGGALAWWCGLARLIATIRHKLDERRLRAINQVAGVVLIGFGAGLLARFLYAFWA